MKIKLGTLRKIIAEAMLVEDPTMASVSADPVEPNGFYSYDLERGVDIHSFWYRSPGRPMGQDGDPFRPEDPYEFLGFHVPPGSAAAPPEAEGEGDTASRGEEADVKNVEELPGGL